MALFPVGSTSLTTTRTQAIIFARAADESRKPVTPLAIHHGWCDVTNMSHKIGGSFTRRGPDVLTEELAVILSGEMSFEFKPLFTLVYANLRARNLASGGEEMCRLRVYEKLHALVSKGMVNKEVSAGVKTYSGLASLAAALPVLPVTKVVG